MSILDKMKEKLLGKRLLVESGIIEGVATQEDGEFVVEMDSEDMAGYEEIQQIQHELSDVLKDLHSLQARANAKYLHLEGKKTMWWAELSAKYPEVSKSTFRSGVHVDEIGKCIRKGLVKTGGKANESKS